MIIKMIIRNNSLSGKITPKKVDQNLNKNVLMLSMCKVVFGLVGDTQASEIQALLSRSQ